MQRLKAFRTQLATFLLLICVASARAQEEWIAPVANRALPAVVTVLAYDGAGKQFGLGSGFVVREDGLIVTNYHVIKGAAAVEVRSKAIGSYRVKGVVAVERGLDYAVLKITGEDLPVLPLGNSSQVRLGEGVVAIGNPKGLTGTISAGLISQVREEEGFTMLQTSAPIYSGNSGGPLINKRGEVIGVVTARVADGPTLGLALPINYVRKALQNGDAVRYTIGALAKLEEKAAAQEKAEEFKALLREHFTSYEDPAGLFNLIVPKDWRAQRDQRWDEDRSTLYYTTVLAPANAKLAQVRGYVSEGMRIQFQLPPEGRVWTAQTVSQWARNVAPNLLQANPGFALTATETAEFGGLTATLYYFVGQDKRLPEPEKTALYAIARPEALLTVEVIAPTSKLEMLGIMQLFSAATFELGKR